MMNESSTSNGSGTLLRPRLPMAMVFNDIPKVESQRGRIIEVNNSDMGRKPIAELDEYLIRTKHLLALMEQRMDSNTKNNHNIPRYPKPWESRNSDFSETDENSEICQAFHGSNSTQQPGVNHRLRNYFKQKNANIASDPSGSSMQSGRRANGRPKAGVQPHSTPRPQSQQPVSRIRTTPESVRRDSSLVTKRIDSGPKEGLLKVIQKNTLSSQSNGNSNQNNNNNTKPFQTPRCTKPDRSGNLDSKIANSAPASPKLPTNVTDNSKITAALNLQRRKAYDPKAARSQSRPNREDDSLCSSTTSSVRAHLPNRRTTQGIRKTAPVETSDVLAAAASLVQQKNGAIFNELLGPRTRRNAEAENQFPEFGRLKNGNLKSFSKADNDIKLRNPNRIASPASARSQSMCGYKDLERRDNRPERMTGLKKNEKLPNVINTRLPTYQMKRTGAVTRCASQSSRTEVKSNGLNKSKKPAPSETNLANNTRNWDNLKNEYHYPDMYVESIKCKVEKITNFVVQLRKRIERDYAETGTCSPGDDVFGEEAVGAVIAGQSTGMHPVVAASLQNLRVLEANAQEIFSLLYPNEVDLWEPARVCLEKGKGDEKLFNDVRSETTEQLSNSLQIYDQIHSGLIQNHTPALNKLEYDIENHLNHVNSSMDYADNI